MRMRLTVNRFAGLLAARGESLAAFDGRCIPAGCVVPRSNTPGILGRRALPAGRLARLGATPDFHHGLLRCLPENKMSRLKEKGLTGKVALVAGATRGAGRGIARALGEAGATVYCSGRSTRRHPATAGRPETIDETAEMIVRDGGRAIAVRTDHRKVAQVRRLIERIRAEQGRLDILVNDIWGGDAWLDWWWTEMKFEKIPLEKGFGVIDTAFKTHVITAHEAIPLMLETKGTKLIAGITDGDGYYDGGQCCYDFGE